MGAFPVLVALYDEEQVASCLSRVSFTMHSWLWVNEGEVRMLRTSERTRKKTGWSRGLVKEERKKQSKEGKGPSIMEKSTIPTWYSTCIPEFRMETNVPEFHYSARRQRLRNWLTKGDSPISLHSSILTIPVALIAKMGAVNTIPSLVYTAGPHGICSFLCFSEKWRLANKCRRTRTNTHLQALHSLVL